MKTKLPTIRTENESNENRWTEKKRNQIDTQTYLNLKTTAIIVVKHEWMAWLFNEINWFELISMELTAQTFWSPWSYVALIWSHRART